MRLLAVGDIHGYLDKLRQLMDLVAPGPDDTVIFLGDYIDRGPNSPGVINYLIEFQRRFPKTIYLGGNHEHLLVLMLLHKQLMQPSEDQLCIGGVPPFDHLFRNAFHWCGGSETVDQYGGWEKIPVEHIRFITNCRLHHQVRIGGIDYIFVHGSVCPGREMRFQDPKTLLWGRDYEFEMPAGQILVHGHTPFVLSTNDIINVDSGVYLDPREFAGLGKLTCCDVLTRKVWWV